MKIKPEESKPPTPLASAKGDLRQLKTNSAATVAELKAFLKQLQGRSPQEMLGIVAGSHLVRAIGISTALVAVAAVVCTAIPYALGAGKKKSTATTKEAAAAPTASKPAIPLPAPAPATGTQPNPEQPTSATPDLSKLGVGEEKKAPPNENPLENKNDDFLKGLE